MKRFDCPSCATSLRFRLLPHVPGAASGDIAFAGWALLSAISLAAGLAATLGIVAAVIVALTATHLFSTRPAYKVAGGATLRG